MERGAPVSLVPVIMLAARVLELAAGLGLALGVFPRLMALALFAFLVPATFISHSVWLAAGTPAFQGQLINFPKNIAIWGGLLFIAGSVGQPCVLPRRTVTSEGSGANAAAFGDDGRMPRFVPVEGLFKGRHFDWEIVVLCVRWYLSFTRRNSRSAGEGSLARSADPGGWTRHI
jgi:hypothetical protein